MPRRIWVERIFPRSLRTSATPVIKSPVRTRAGCNLSHARPSRLSPLRHIGNRLLMQQQLRRLHAPVAVEPSLHHAILQEICHCQQRHPLVMRHKGPHELERPLPESPLSIRVIRRCVARGNGGKSRSAMIGSARTRPRAASNSTDSMFPAEEAPASPPLAASPSRRTLEARSSTMCRASSKLTTRVGEPEGISE